MNTPPLPASVLVKNQVKTYGPKFYTEDGTRYRITAKVRYDDECRNGHNSFSITAEIDRQSGGRWMHDTGGCCHDEVAKHFPQLAPFIKWHLTSSDGPMHYVQNSLYWAGQTKWEKPNLTNFRSTAVWPDASESDMNNANEAVLLARLPALMAEFKTAVESLGFTY